jgi:hypothetical protein
VVLTPVAHQDARWLLVHALERSDPNTATARAMLPSMLKEQGWWLVFDGRGRQACSAAAAGADPTPVALRGADAGSLRAPLLARLRKACGSVPTTGLSWLAADPAATWRWVAGQVCAGKRCAATATPQRSLRGARAQVVDGAAAAPARCVADRWLIVTNGEAEAGSGAEAGARFAGLPPAVRDDIVGFETVRIDGITTLSAGRACP